MNLSCKANLQNKLYTRSCELLPLNFTFLYQTIYECVGVATEYLPVFNIHDTIYENSQSLSKKSIISLL
jgi:hypothetical protein